MEKLWEMRRRMRNMCGVDIIIIIIMVGGN